MGDALTNLAIREARASGPARLISILWLGIVAVSPAARKPIKAITLPHPRTKCGFRASLRSCRQ